MSIFEMITASHEVSPSLAVRYSVSVYGRVQGCGFRSFCTRTAKAHSLTGWVSNDENDFRHVCLEVQGTEEQIDAFLSAIVKGNGFSIVDKMDKLQLDVNPRELGFLARYM